MPGNPLRHQLPAWTPLGVGALVRSALGGGARDPLPELREGLSEELGADEVVLTGSGTQALSLALGVAEGRRRGKSGEGDGRPAPIALPAWSCYDLASAAVYHGAPVHFYDIDPRTLAPEERSFEGALEAGAKTVVVAPHFGVPIKMVHAEEVAHHYGATLIVDAAQGWGARFEGRLLGSGGELAVLSFGRGKGWTAGGGGGALLVRGGGAQAVLETGARAPSPWAGGLALLLLARPGIYRVPRSIPALGLGVTRFDPPVPPGPMGRSTARLLLAMKKRAFAEARGRAARGDSMYEALERVGAGDALVQLPAGSEPGWLRFPVLVSGGIAALEALAERRAGRPGPIRLGAAQGYPEILPELEALRGLIAPGAPRGADAFPGARRLAHDLVTLPTHSLVLAREREVLLALVAAASGGAGGPGGVPSSR